MDGSGQTGHISPALWWRRRYLLVCFVGLDLLAMLTEVWPWLAWPILIGSLVLLVLGYGVATVKLRRSRK